MALNLERIGDKADSQFNQLPDSQPHTVTGLHCLSADVRYVIAAGSSEHLYWFQMEKLSISCEFEALVSSHKVLE